MKVFNKCLSVVLSLVLIIASLSTVLPTSYAESSVGLESIENEIDGEFKYSSEVLKDLIPGEDYAEGEIIIKYTPEEQTESIEDFANEHNLTLENNLGENTDSFKTSSVDESIVEDDVYVLSFDKEKSVIDLMQEISGLNEVEYVQPNFIYKTCEIEESMYTLDSVSNSQVNQYQQAMFSSMNFNDTEYTGQDVVVAVIDSGIDFSHPALQNSMWSYGDIAGFSISSLGGRRTITSTDTDIYYHYHGTHVAGIIAMKPIGQYTCKGVAPNTRIMNLQTVLSTAGIVEALNTAVEYGADVVNMSFGDYTYDHLLNIACNKVARKLVLVAAAGNDGYERNMHYPSGFSSVIGVMAYGGSSNINDYPKTIKASVNNNALEFLNVNYPSSGDMITASFTNTDSKLKYYEIIAPGVNVCSAKARTAVEITFPLLTNYQYVFLSGTSMAAPVVSGVVAMYIEKYPDATPGQIRDVFRRDSEKSVEKFESYIQDDYDNPDKFISNQIDISKILSYTPDSQIDALFENNDSPDYEYFCDFIKAQFDGSFNDGESITNEDIRLISFLEIKSISDIENVVEYLPLLNNLIGIYFNSSDIDDTTCQYVLENCIFSELEILIFESTNIINLAISSNVFPKLYKLELKNNSKLENISNLSVFPDLTYVYMPEHELKDLSMFENTTSIEVLDLHNNKITSIFPLRNNSKLKIVDLSNNYISDISIFSDCSKLYNVDLSNNLISDWGGILQNTNLQTLYIHDNLLQQCELEVESFLKSREVDESKLSILFFKPYKEIVSATDITAYNMTIKRTDKFVTPDIVVYPYSATFAQNIELTASNSLVKVNEHSNTIQFNQAYNEYNNYNDYLSEISYSYNELEGSFNVDVLMPIIKSASLELYNFYEQPSEYYVSLVTTTDTTKIKVEYLGVTRYIIDEFTLCSDNVYFKDYGDERIIKIKLNEAPSSTNANITIETGDELGYLPSKTLGDNVVNISVRNGYILEVFGNADMLLVDDSRIEGVAQNAIDSSCNINTIIMPNTIMDLEYNSFVDANVSVLYINSPYVSARTFNNCSDMIVYSSKRLDWRETTNVTINDDFEVSDNTLSKYYGTALEVIIPPYFGVTQIGSEAFKCNQSIEKIDLSKSIDNIGNSAFENCTKLSDIGGKLNLFSLGSFSFYGTAIGDIYINYMDICEETEELWESAFSSCSNLKTVNINSISMMIFGDNVFKNCEQLESVNLDNEYVFELGDSCFENCNLMNNINFENISIKGERAFAYCESLTGNIVYNYSTIPKETFLNCSSITSISCRRISERVNIYENAFKGTIALKTLGLTTPVILYYSGAFNGISEDLTIYTSATIRKAPNSGDSISDQNIPICDDFKLAYDVTNDTVLLSQYTGNNEDVVVPECLKIDVIDSNSFSNCENIVSVSLPKSVTVINSKAFSGNEYIETIIGGTNVQIIYEEAFKDCTQLKCIDSLDSIITIGEYAFSNTGIEKLSLPNTYLAGDEGAFYNCSKLKEIELNGLSDILPANFLNSCENLERCVLTYSISEIAENAFADCSKLMQVYLPDSVEYIYPNALPISVKVFSSNNFCPIIEIQNQVYPNYEVVNGVLLDYQSETGYDYIDNNGKQVVDIPNAVRKISDWVFFGNQNVDKVITSEYLKIIGEYAFMDCSITEILLPQEMSSIGRSAFNRTGITSIDIPDGITKLEPFFMHCAPIQQVTIPESVTEICNDAFGDCQKLQSVYIPGNITSIDPSAFAGAAKPITLWGNDNSYLMQYANDNSLQNENNVIVCRLGFNIAGDVLNGYTGNDINVQVPTYMQLNSIGDAAFKNNTTVESISIASGISNIGSECFSGCTSLSSLLISDDVVYVGENAFYGIPNLTIYCNEGSYIEGYCIENNINVNTDYDISDGVLNAYNGTATNLVIPSNWFITSIGEYAFDSNTNIASVTIPEGVREIGASAFGGCSALTTVVLPASNGIKLSAVAFIDCINLTNIVNSTSITRVGNSAFSYCTSLESIDLSNVETIGAYGFDFCPSLTNVILGTSVTSIWRNAFTDCENLVINCYSNTYAHQYAMDNDIPYVLLDEFTMSGFSFRRSFKSNTTNSSSIENIEERTIPSIENKLDDYIQRECNGKVTKDNLDDIIAYMVDNGWNNHLI